MSEIHIQLKSINKKYRTNKYDFLDVLKDFTLDIYKGEIFSIYGPNGCGKSTILGIIADILSPDKGEVIINNKAPKVGDVGYLFQDYNMSLFPWLTCAENISFSFRLKGMNKKERLNKATSLTNQLQIDIDLDKYPYQLSSGQQQLIALARALCNSPSVLVMDEPFSSLDSSMREKVRCETVRIIEELNLTAVLVSHNLEDCVFCSDKIAFLTALPARIFSIEGIPEEQKQFSRKVHSDIFAEMIEKFKGISLQAIKT